MSKQAENPPVPLQGVNTGHLNRLAILLVKLLGTIAVIEGLIIIGLLSAFLALLPLKQVEPFFIALHGKEDQVLRIEPYYQDTDGFRILLEQFARAYVVKRETIDVQTEQTRWYEISLMSSDEVFQVFRDMMESRDGPYAKAAATNLTRDVQILSVSAISEDQFIVEFFLTTRKKGSLEVVSKQRVNAALTFTLAERITTGEDRFINPIGFSVIAYSLAEKAL